MFWPSKRVGRIRRPMVKDMFGRAIPSKFQMGVTRVQLAEGLWEYGEDELARRALELSEEELVEVGKVAVWHYLRDYDPPRPMLGRIWARALIEFAESNARDTVRKRRRIRPESERCDARYRQALLSGAPLELTPVEQGLPDPRREVRVSVSYSRDDNGTWLAKASDIPGAHSYGNALEEARANIREAIAVTLHIEPATIDLAETVSHD